MSYYITLHDNMKRARLNAGLTQTQVAEKSWHYRKTISAI